MAIQYVVYGSIEDIEAEYGLPDMGQEWYDRWKYTHVVKIIADEEYDVVFCCSFKEAKEDAKNLASELGVKVYSV